MKGSSAGEYVHSCQGMATSMLRTPFPRLNTCFPRQTAERSVPCQREAEGCWSSNSEFIHGCIGLGQLLSACLFRFGFPGRRALFEDLLFVLLQREKECRSHFRGVRSRNFEHIRKRGRKWLLLTRRTLSKLGALSASLAFPSNAFPPQNDTRVEGTLDLFYRAGAFITDLQKPATF